VKDPFNGKKKKEKKEDERMNGQIHPHDCDRRF